MDFYKKSVELHRIKKGKLEICSKVSLNNRNDLSMAYTPGVAGVCSEIAKDPSKAYDYTIKGNCVAVVTDGSAVLGLGNIGAQAALPVMEGKAVLFKKFAGIDAFPICFSDQDAFQIVNAVKNLVPSFGGINLEDISAPRCFEIEAALQDIGIPVFHDDQHGTAIVVLAALLNALKLVGKRIEEIKVVISGVGAAGIAITRLLLCVGYDRQICIPVKEIDLCDSRGVIYDGREGLNKHKRYLAKVTNLSKRKGSLADVMKGADVFIGVSKGGIVTKKMVRSMNKDAIVFALANPVPEIMPEDARKAGAAIVGSGRSDFPNQINNVLAFPGVFRGALDAKATTINNEMKLAAAYALASCVSNPDKDHIIPRPFDISVVKRVAAAVKKAAVFTGVSRK